MQSRVFRNLFKAMDRDGDGKLFEKEVIAYLDAMQDLQSARVGGLRLGSSPTTAAACSTWPTPTTTAGSASARCARWSS